VSDSSSNEQQHPREWSLSRVAGAVVILIVVLGGIAYGIYSLTNSSTSTKPTTSQSSHLVNPTPPPTTSKTKTSTKPSNTSSTNGADAAKSSNQNSSSASTSPTSNSTQLTNTGPGDVAIIGFIVAFVLGGAIHYLWRKRHLTY